MGTKTEKDLWALEKQFWKALQDKDEITAIRLTDFPCIVSGPQGVGSVDELTFRAMVRDPRYTIRRAELKDPQVRMLRDDVAVVAYRVHEELTVEGEPVTLEAADSSTWIRRKGQWACAEHAEAIVGDPFGRDVRK
jgi:hypothetical protein